MPYHVARGGQCPASKPWAVVKAGDGEVMGCHATEVDADRQVAALYANEPEMREQLVAAAAPYLRPATTVEAPAYGAVAVTDDAWLRERADVILREGLPELRRFDPHQPRDPGGDHGGEWVKGPASAAKAAAKALGKISEDDFFAAHGEDWHDQYGPTSELGAILWKNGEASLYRDVGKGKVHAFGDVDSHGARRLAGDLKWAVGQPDEGDPGGGKLAGHRQVELGQFEAEVGYGYNGEGELFVRVTMPPVGKDKKPTPIDLEDLDQVEQLVEDLGKLADDLDSKAYTRSMPNQSRLALRRLTYCP